ncbi:hypothetical protein jhhlp_004319 [Lomentospora prolificans]|uniref:BHLH domain-containing protein n=1 Tax=Lomentospora prolificans TaxID=41688 RepID=A0A2N3NB86_9PEZI|nr:hypothetical protein jhhlp_004319 [Lomentospora prolificans]
MLALRQPKRESTESSDPSLPFGYAFNESQEAVPNPPPSPPPGDPILSAEDSISLQHFLENLSSDHFIAPSYGEGLNFTDTWLDLPPQLVGSTTSLGQHPVTDPAAMAGGFYMRDENNVSDETSQHASTGSMAPPPLPHGGSHPLQASLAHHASPDVLAGAALLPRNGLLNPNGFHSAPLVPQTQFSSLRDLGPGYRHEPGAALGNALLRNGFPGVNNGEAQFPSLPYGGQQQQQHQHQQQQQPQQERQQLASQLMRASEIQWGTDDSFNHGQGYVPQSHNDTHESLSQRQLQMMQCLQVAPSAATTRPSSPVADQASPAAAGMDAPMVAAEPTSQEPPRKRPKGTSSGPSSADGGDETSPPATTPKSARRGKGSSTGAAAKKRRRSGNGTKAPRENLTDEQRRANHIRSEQKRRNIIKNGFDDLCKIVPALRDNRASKKIALSVAADWLDSLLCFNSELTDILTRVKGEATG